MRPTSSSTATELREFLKTNQDEELTLMDVAEKFSVTRQVAQRAIYEVVRQGTGQYVHVVRHRSLGKHK